MVDFAAVPKAMALRGEARNLDRVIDALGDGGKITGLTIASNGRPVNLITIGWEYPEQMVAAIRDKCQTRLDEIARELEDLGVTGVAEDRR